MKPSPTTPVTTAKSDDHALSMIETYLANVANNLRAIAELYVARCDASKTFHDKFRARFPRVTATFIAGLERVGRGVMTPDLLLTGADQQQIVSVLPISVQERIIANGVEIVTTTGTKTLPISALPPSLLVQAIDQKSKTVRTVEEQQAWIAYRAQEREAVLAPKKMRLESKKEVRFRVLGSMLEIIDAPVVLTESDVRALLAEMVRGKR